MFFPSNCLVCNSKLTFICNNNYYIELSCEDCYEYCLSIDEYSVIEYFYIESSHFNVIKNLYFINVGFRNILGCKNGAQIIIYGSKSSCMRLTHESNIEKYKKYLALI